MTMIPTPKDYETCGDCGLDHAYDYDAAVRWHRDHPCSYCDFDHHNNLHQTYCPTQSDKTFR
jgi:hypothetical protein